MATVATESPLPRDAYSPGDSVIIHDAETTQGYREAAQEAARKGPGKVIPSRQPAIQAGSLPTVGVARQVANREVGRLRAQAEAGQRDLTGRFTFTASGQQLSDPVQIGMRTRLAADIEAATEEANRLAGLDDVAVRQWAFSKGVR
jgi:hypothetical protein